MSSFETNGVIIDTTSPLVSVWNEISCTYKRSKKWSAVKKGGKQTVKKLCVFVTQMHWLRVGVLAELAEERVGGYVYQSDREGIMTAWDVEDPQSGIVKQELAVGTTSGHFPLHLYCLHCTEYVQDKSFRCFCLFVYRGH